MISPYSNNISFTQTGSVAYFYLPTYNSDMYCPSCGKEIIKEDKYCGYCGIGVQHRHNKSIEIQSNEINPDKNVNAKSKKKKPSLNYNGLFWWKLNDAEVKNQVDNYNLLKITQSYRGISALLLLVSVILTFLFIGLGAMQISAGADAVVALVLAYFVYKGHSWAMISAMVYWSFEKGYQLSQNPSSSLGIIIWWTLYMGAFWGAFKVERLRRNE